jgi:hypothetical protein
LVSAYFGLFQSLFNSRLHSFTHEQLQEILTLSNLKQLNLTLNWLTIIFDFAWLHNLKKLEGINLQYMTIVPSDNISLGRITKFMLSNLQIPGITLQIIFSQISESLVELGLHTVNILKEENLIVGPFESLKYFYYNGPNIINSQLLNAVCGSAKSLKILDVEVYNLRYQIAADILQKFTQIELLVCTSIPRVNNFLK